MKLGIRSHLYAGFGTLVLIVCSLGGFALYQQDQLGKQYAYRSHVQDLARDVLAVSGLASQLSDRAEQYRLAPRADRIAGLEETRAALAGMTETLIEKADTEERGAVYRQMRDGARALASELQRLAVAGSKLTEAKDNLVKGGDDLARATKELITNVRANGSPSQIGQAANLDGVLLTLQLTNWRFQATSEAKGPAMFLATLGRAGSALKTLRMLDDEGSFTQQIAALDTVRIAYNEVFKVALTAIADAQTSYDTGIRPLTAEIERSASIVRGELDEVVAAVTARTTAATAAAALIQTILTGCAAVLGIGLAFLIARSIIRPISAMTRAMSRLAAGDTNLVVPSQDAVDEMGAMAKAVEVFRHNAVARAQLEADQLAEQSDRRRRADRVDQLVRAFDTRITGSLDVVAAASTQLDATARSMTDVAANANAQALASSAAAEQTSVNVQTVAASAEEMVASLREIERQVQRSNEVAGVAQQEIEGAGVSMSDLAQAAEKIGTAVTLISTIAGQTNLLALNATIEAARAGEAGRGFAVVASEVKELAGQTAHATQEITGQIAAIQTASTGAMAAIRQIGRTIVSVNAVTGSIAVTVVEQTAATDEISRNAAEAARGTRDVSMNVTQVLASATETGSAADQVLKAAAELATQSQSVKRDVDAFLDAIRAA